MAYRKIIDDFIIASAYNNVDHNDIIEKLNSAKKIIVNISTEALNDYAYNYKIMYGEKIKSYEECNDDFACDIFILFNMKNKTINVKLLTYAKYHSIPYVFSEEGFLHNIFSSISYDRAKKFTYRHSVVLDSNCMHFFSRFPSSLERMLNSSRELSEEELNRATLNIKKLVECRISKYNNQPINNKINTGYNGKKVLVIDQVYGDASITYGMANEQTFEYMLKSAIEENPNADIIVKTHPDLKVAARKGYYSELQSHDNIYVINYDVNPYCLLENVDKVYVCTSGMGFEALMCGKEVHTFGMPFYAGWGVTHDRLECERRTRTRSVEEIFYFAYIKYSHYVSYKTNSRCEIEQCIEELLELREEYMTNNKI